MAEITADQWQSWLLAKAEAAKWKDVIKALEEKFIEALGDDEEELAVEGRVVASNKIKQVTRVDTKALRNDLPEEALRPYLRTQQERSGFRAVD